MYLWQQGGLVGRDGWYVELKEVTMIIQDDLRSKIKQAFNIHVQSQVLRSEESSYLRRHGHFRVHIGQQEQSADVHNLRFLSRV